MNHLPVFAWKITSLPMTIISGGLRLVSSAISLLLPYSLSGRGEGSSLVDEIETSALEAMRFVTMFENKYGHGHPSFVAKSFTDVLQQSECESKLMFVYLHSPGHPDTDTFCGETLCSRILVDFVNENFVAWGGSIEASEGFKMSNSLKASRFPFCAVVRPDTNQRFALLQQIEGPKSPEEMLTVFQRVLEESSRVPVAARPETDKRITNFPFREELDFARQAALESGQEIVMKPMEEMLVLNTSNSSHNNNNNHSNLSLRSSFEKLHRPEEAATLNCPRCNSTNTRFCYYNNYSLVQPRYFCKSCRRYWIAAGGKLRNKNQVRMNKRSSLSSSSSESSEKLPELAIPSSSTSVLSSPNSKISPHKQNLNFQMTNFDATLNPASNTITSSTGITSRGMMNSFMLNPNPIPDPISMFPMSEFKIPSLGFSLDGIERGGGGLYGNENGRVVFPFEELKTNASTSHDDQQVMIKEDQNCDSNGFGSGMISGGSW